MHIEKPSLKGVQFQAMQPEAITAEKANIKHLLMQQLDRVNFLLTIGLSTTTESRVTGNITRGTLFGLRSIESMMCTDLEQEYYDKAVEIKAALPQSLTMPRSIDNPITRWYDLLVKHMHKLDMIPAKKIPFDFED